MVYHQNESCNGVEDFPDKCSMCVLELLDPSQNRKANAGDNIKVSVRHDRISTYAYAYVQVKWFGTFSF